MALFVFKIGNIGGKMALKSALNIEKGREIAKSLFQDAALIASGIMLFHGFYIFSKPLAWILSGVCLAIINFPWSIFPKKTGKKAEK